MLSWAHYIFREFIGSNYCDDASVKIALAEDPSHRKRAGVIF
jgi:hypothetical protein